MKIQRLLISDLRSGADWLHEKLDGRIRLPHKLKVFLAGLIPALVVVGGLMLWHIARGGEVFWVK